MPKDLGCIYGNDRLAQNIKEQRKKGTFRKDNQISPKTYRVYGFV